MPVGYNNKKMLKTLQHKLKITKRKRKGKKTK
jgi:hypothetical protein